MNVFHCVELKQSCMHPIDISNLVVMSLAEVLATRIKISDQQLDGKALDHLNLQQFRGQNGRYHLHGFCTLEVNF